VKRDFVVLTVIWWERLKKRKIVELLIEFVGSLKGGKKGIGGK
jgi:hypothetical protein